MRDANTSRAAFVHDVATDVQIAAGAAPYATVEELVDIFSRVADRLPSATTEMERMLLRRLLASVTRHVCEETGAERPHRPIVALVSDADDPLDAFKRALTSLAHRPDPLRGRRRGEAGRGGRAK